MERLDIPDYTWSEKAKESNAQLEKYSLSNNWERYILNSQTGKIRTYLYFGNEKVFYGAMFFSVKEQAAKWSVTYGPWSNNGAGIVHGGLIATHHDAITGILAENCFGSCLTASLNVNYKSPMPVGSTFLFECKVVKVEGRKIFLESKINNFETNKLVGDASALYVLVDKESSL
ncbi:acyl-coenzyme A thioesterase THEM4 isoform X1 [Hydra vulgaris]|uniref:acyl-coenzyme A thioesterase THEM4 isoform X1 n=1 Tax=Hydra vulgaris TaxID=6087 RepID=UPI000640EA04|nr:acyl-coenzyme A thioesterase THEM4 [Hydra vulgaris]